MKRFASYFVLVSSIALFIIACAKEQSLVQSKDFKALSAKAADSIGVSDTTRHDTIPPHDTISHHDTIPYHDTIPRHDTIWHPVDTIHWVDTTTHNNPYPPYTPPTDSVPVNDSTGRRRRFSVWVPKVETLYQRGIRKTKDVYYNGVVTYWSKDRFIS